MGLISFRRQPPAATLHEELRRLEERARSARADSGAAYSRSLLARESGVSESTLAAWLDRGRIPQEAGKLLEVVRVLAGWAGGMPADTRWQDLLAAARNTARASKGSQDARDAAAGKGRDWARRKLVLAAGTAMTALITGLFAAFGGDLHSLLPWGGSTASAAVSQPARQSPRAGSGQGRPAAAEDFQARANWCCQLVSVEASTGFYWPGAASSLSAALATGRGAVQEGLMPAGVGLIEIPLQTSGTEPILVAPPKVIIRSRRRNVTAGMIAILPRGGQGIGSAGQFEADVDSPAPVTVAFGTPGSAAPSYQYVSTGSPDVMTLFVTDVNYDCTFDIQLSWQEQGHVHDALLTNGGKHFRIIGSAGLPWYAGDPVLGRALSRVPAGQPFSRYAPN